MKNLSLLLTMLMALSGVTAQTLVLDESKILELSENQLVLLAALESTENTTQSLQDVREEISAKATLVHTLQAKLYSSLSKVPEGFNSLGKLRSCQQSASDIYHLQQEIISLSGEDPQLLTVALGLSWALAERTASLAFTLREGVMKGGEENLISAAQRLELLSHLDSELKELRSICLQVRSRLRLLKKGQIESDEIAFPEYDPTLVARILKEVK